MARDGLQRIALHAPTGDVLRVLRAPTGPKESNNARAWLRKYAAGRFGQKWWKLRNRGFRVARIG